MDRLEGEGVAVEPDFAGELLLEVSSAGKELVEGDELVQSQEETIIFE